MVFCCPVLIDLFQNCPEMKILHDIVNTIKHKELTSPKVEIREAKSHSGDFSSDFSNDFDIARLEIHFEDGSCTNVAKLLEAAIDYWDSNLH